MSRSNDLLDHLEQVHEEYGEVVEKTPIEDKFVLAYEETQTLEPWEISEIVQSSLNGLPAGLEDHIDVIFDVVYDAVSEALDRTRR